MSIDVDRRQAGRSDLDVCLPPLRLAVPEPENNAWLPRLPLARLGQSARRHRGALALLLIVVALAGVVHAWGMATSPARVDDEGTYVAQAWAVQQGRGLAHYTYWYDHPPAGWIQLAGWTSLTGAFDRAQHAVAAGREAMLLVKLVSCVLLYVLGRRLGMRTGWAAAGVLLFSLSPLAVSFQRMVFLDNIATPWLLGAFVLALSPERRTSAAVWSGICFGIAVLSKETALVIFPALVWQAWRHAHPRTRRVAVPMLVVSAGMVVATYPLFALLKGEFLPGPDHVSLLSAAHWQLFMRPGSGSILDPTSSVRGLIRSWIDLDPWFIWTGLAALPVSALCRRFQPVALAIAIQLTMLVRGGYVPHPYLITVIPFAAVLLAGLGDTLWRVGGEAAEAQGRRLRMGSLGAAVAGGARLPARLLAVGAVVCTFAIAGPVWAHDLRHQMTVDADAPMRAAAQWVQDNVDRSNTVVVDDSIWVDLVRAGFPERNVIWFYKLDLDPGVKLPRGWRELEYLVLGPIRSESLAMMPKLQVAVEHSSIVASFGQGSSAVHVYEVQK